MRFGRARKTARSAVAAPLALLALALPILAGCGSSRTTGNAAAEVRAAESLATARSLERRPSMEPAAQSDLLASDQALAASKTATTAESLASAAVFARDAWRARSRWLGASDIQTGEAALALAEAEMAIGRAGEADSMAQQALAIYTQVLGPAHPRVADAEDLLGRIVKNYTGAVAFDRALAHYQRALDIRTQAEGPRSLAAAATLHNLGNLHRLAEKNDQAYQYFGRALEIRRAALGPVHDEVASTLGAMAFLRAGQGRWAEAEVLSRQALGATPPHVGMGPRSLRLGLRGQALRRIGRSEEAVPVLREAVALRESLWLRTPRDAGSSVIAGLALYRDLALALASVGRGDEAFVQLEHGVSRVGIDPAGDRDDPDPWRGLIPRVQRALRSDEAIVIWPRSSTTMFVPDRPLYACVVRSRGPVQWTRLDSRARYPRLGTVREALWTEMRAASAWPRRAVDTTTVAQLAQVMWKERFAPLEPSLADVQHLIVCSPDYMAGGPLGVLRDDKGRYLTERFAISYVPSALRFARARERAHAPGPRPALLVGDPDYPTADPGHFSRLTGAAEEIRELATRMPSATVLTGVDARAGRLRQLAASGAIGHYGVVHIAAHTEVNPTRALESSLVLAPDPPGGPESSRLVAREIADDWKLDADLVCLAGCRSMQGLPSATEGFLGLQQAFFAAGARSLLITIWPVDDQATARLMTSFYAHLADRSHPVDRAEALREAQNELRTWRSPDGRHPYAHPAYWAGFALVGDPG